MNQEQKPQEPQKSQTTQAANSNSGQSTDPRQEAIEQEQDTARLRSEKQSVEDGSKQDPS